MRRYIYNNVLCVAMLFVIAVAPAWSRELVIMHTNDTHSQIDPTDKGYGGIQRRKAFVDSVRNASDFSLLVDAGDAVQGTLFFTLYGGEVEMKVMNLLGYDLAILGNHDFDNGMERLRDNVSASDAAWLSTNYSFADPKLRERFAPYKIYEFDGRKIGFIGLNLDPVGMIAAGNYDGVSYNDAVDAANAAAWWLKHQLGVDFVVAVSHLGYEGVPSPSDIDIIENSRDIDLLLGGHSHTVITPGSGREWVKNRDGKPVLVAQNGKSGEYISEITVDLDSLSRAPRLRHVRLGEGYQADDDSVVALVAPFRKGVDDLMNLRIGASAKPLPNDQPALLNFLSDFVAERGSELAGRKVDVALMNVGSLRRGLPKGDITQGMIISMQPFANKIEVMELLGKDLIEAMEVYARRGGDGLSDAARVTFDPATASVKSFTIEGKDVDPEAVYLVATIDYLANGGDYMTPLKNGRIIASSDDIVYDDLINYIKTKYKRKKINPSDTPRFVPVSAR